MNIQILVGSFHSHSRSLAIARSIKDMLKEHQCDIPTLDTLPFYSEDLAQQKPVQLLNFLTQIEQSDALICVTPEYNHSIPAVLKNAIDWASRPAFHSPLKDKPVAIITQADSPVGGARAQAHLKLVLDSTLSVIFPSHEMMIAGVAKVINAQNQLQDADTQRRIARYLDEFISFASKQNSRHAETLGSLCEVD